MPDWSPDSADAAASVPLVPLHAQTWQVERGPATFEGCGCGCCSLAGGSVSLALSVHRTLSGSVSVTGSVPAGGQAISGSMAALPSIPIAFAILQLQLLPNHVLGLLAELTIDAITTART